MKTPSIDESVHIISGASAAGSLLRVGGHQTIVLQDALSPGPCDVNPVRHREKRQAFLRGYSEPVRRRRPRLYAASLKSLSDSVLNAYDLVERLSASPHKPFMIWTAPSWNDRLSFWWVLDALQRTRQPIGRFWVAEVAPDGGLSPDRVIAFSLGTYPPGSFRNTEPRPLDRNLLATGTSLWRAFAGPSPAGFDIACQETHSFPDLPRVMEPYGKLFPRILGERMILCEFDQAILDALSSDAWQRPVDLERASREIVDLFWYYGDLFLPRRLRDWAGTPRVLMQEEPNGVSEYTAASFRLTEVGERLREQGMQAPGEAPEMWIGGCRLYGKRPWVRRKQGNGWRFEQVEA